jgi:hypothetical protein
MKVRKYERVIERFFFWAMLRCPAAAINIQGIGWFQCCVGVTAARHANGVLVGPSGGTVRLAGELSAET